jgi:hypothetical protein
MSRLINSETLKEHEESVNKYFSDKKAILDKIKVPNTLGERMVAGHYTGDTSEDVSLDEMKNFWKVPESAGSAVDAVAKRARLFYAGISTGGLGIATTLASDPKGYSDLINFSDSDAALDPDNKSKLYYYLTPEEQEQYKSDESAQTATQWGSILGGIFLGQPELAMAGANQGIRETTQETFGMRHPALLKNAVERRNRDLQFEFNFKNELENNKKALAETKRDYDLADVSSDLYVQKMTPIMNDIHQRSTGQSPNLPVVTNLPSISSIPINMAVGRGLGNFNDYLAPEMYMWDRAMAGGGLHQRLGTHSLVRY